MGPARYRPRPSSPQPPAGKRGARGPSALERGGARVPQEPLKTSVPMRSTTKVSGPSALPQRPSPARGPSPSWAAPRLALVLAPSRRPAWPTPSVGVADVVVVALTALLRRRARPLRLAAFTAAAPAPVLVGCRVSARASAPGSVVRPGSPATPLAAGVAISPPAAVVEAATSPFVPLSAMCGQRPLRVVGRPRNGDRGLRRYRPPPRRWMRKAERPRIHLRRRVPQGGPPPALGTGRPVRRGPRLRRRRRSLRPQVHAAAPPTPTIAATRRRLG